MSVGTTDTLYDGDPDDVAVEEADVTQVWRGIGRLEDSTATGSARRSQGSASYRAAPARRRAPLERRSSRTARRDVERCRWQAHDVPAHCARSARPTRRPAGRPAPLATAGRCGTRPRDVPGYVEPALRSHLLHLYGSLAGEVLAPAVEDPSLLEPIAPGGPDIRAQDCTRGRTVARTDEDVLRRGRRSSCAGSAGVPTSTSERSASPTLDRER